MKLKIGVVGNDFGLKVPVIYKMAQAFALSLEDNKNLFPQKFDIGVPVDLGDPRTQDLPLPDGFEVEVEAVCDPQWHDGDHYPARIDEVFNSWIYEYRSGPFFDLFGEKVALAVETDEFNSSDGWIDTVNFTEEIDPDEYHIIFYAGIPLPEEERPGHSINLRYIGSEDDWDGIRNGNFQQKMNGMFECMKHVFGFCQEFLINQRQILHKLHKLVQSENVTNQEEQYQKVTERLVESLDMGVEVDVAVLKDAHRQAMRDLFMGKKLTPWYEFLLSSMIQGMMASLPSVAEAYAFREKELGNE